MPGLTSDCPVVVVAHSDVLLLVGSGSEIRRAAGMGRYRRQVVAGLAAAARVVAPTAAVLDDLERHYVRAGERRRGDLRTGSSRHAFPALDKLPVVLAAGRLWDAAKNLDCSGRGRAGPCLADRNRRRASNIRMAALRTCAHVRLLGV